jgi:hypothetical protein
MDSANPDLFLKHRNTIATIAQTAPALAMRDAAVEHRTTGR